MSQGKENITYEEFKEKAVKFFNKTVLDPKEVSIRKIKRNNGVEKEVLTVFSEGKILSPPLDVKKYFRMAKEGGSVPTACRKMFAEYESGGAEKKRVMQELSDYETAKEHLIFFLVNGEKNKERLLRMPHFPYLDLAVVFGLLVKINGEYGFVEVDGRMMESWGVDENTLLGDAARNTEEKSPAGIASVKSVCETPEGEKPKLVPVGAKNKLPENDGILDMWMVTNRIQLYGAGVLLYDDVLKTIAKKTKTDLLVLPGSVHEVMVAAIKGYAIDSAKEAQSIIECVNRTLAEPEEVLSKNAYIYRMEEEKLFILGEE